MMRRVRHRIIKRNIGSPSLVNLYFYRDFIEEINELESLTGTKILNYDNHSTLPQLTMLISELRFLSDMGEARLGTRHD